jgi:fibronectin-binding autotransporter adhesin
VDQTGRNFNVGTGAAGHCTVVVDGGTVDSSNFFVGHTHASSTLLVEGGGLLSSTGISGTAGVIDATGSATATVSGGTWLLAGGNLTIGAFAAGSLDVNGGGGIGVVNAGTNEIDIGQFGNAAHGTASVETGGTLLGGQLVVSDGTGATTGVLNIGAGGLVEVANVSDNQGGDITVGGGTAAAEVSSCSLFGIGQIGANVTLTIGSLGTVTGTGGNTLEVLSGSTVAVNDGTLGGFGDVDGGAFGADSPGTLVATGGGTLEGAAVSVGNGGLLHAGSLPVGGAITGGEIGNVSIETGGTVLVSTITLTTGGVIDLNGGVLDPITMDVTDAGGIGGSGIIGASGTLEANFAFAASGDSLTYSSFGGTLEIVGSITGAGALVLATGGNILLDEAPNGAQSVTFGLGTETLILRAPALNTTAFAGMAVGFHDLIDFGNGVVINSVGSAAGTDGPNVVTVHVTDGGGEQRHYLPRQRPFHRRRQPFQHRH